jgi:hypothetical protein
VEVEERVEDEVTTDDATEIDVSTTDDVVDDGGESKGEGVDRY